MSLASELNRAMVARGLSNRAVAEAVGRSRDFISQMRNGRVYPSHECGCTLGTEDADRRDCACGGPCCWVTWGQFIEDVVRHPSEYDVGGDLYIDPGEPYRHATAEGGGDAKAPGQVDGG